jgi:hypothetical protein
MLQWHTPFIVPTSPLFPTITYRILMLYKEHACMMASNSCFHSLRYVMGWQKCLLKCVQSHAIVGQRILIILISNRGINVITEHTCRIQNESECNVKNVLILIIQKLRCLPWRMQLSIVNRGMFLGAFVPCKSSTKITVCLSVYPSARGKQLQTCWTNFHKIVYLKDVPKFSEPLQFSYVCVYIYVYIRQY